MNDIRLLYIDLFCGAGGTSTGVEKANYKGRKCAKVIACVNHDANAIASHESPRSAALYGRYANLGLTPIGRTYRRNAPNVPYGESCALGFA